jgi:hypothetical protein
MSNRSVSDIQTRAEGESLYIRYRSDANVLSYLKNDPSYEFIGEIILKINIVLRRISSPRTKLLAARCECLHLIKMNCLAFSSAHASLAASCEELRARTGNPPLSRENQS